jgi:hypothetical protein
VCPTGFEPHEESCKSDDQDQDGILNKVDRCVEEPEDKDGFLDTDGCVDPDNDADQVDDKNDRCPDAREDHDGYNDGDGCPEADNDGDGLLDENDKCPDVAEDQDGYEDDDGCVDRDDDRDGVNVPEDACPDEAEDADNWQDEDGCPDPDNDEDGVLDGLDQCVEQREDRDGFEDEDGCLDADNDSDDIPDDQDACIDEPEEVNDVRDEDGCPEPQRWGISWFEGDSYGLMVGYGNASTTASYDGSLWDIGLLRHADWFEYVLKGRLLVTRGGNGIELDNKMGIVPLSWPPRDDPGLSLINPVIGVNALVGTDFAGRAGAANEVGIVGVGYYWGNTTFWRRLIVRVEFESYNWVETPLQEDVVTFSLGLRFR